MSTELTERDMPTDQGDLAAALVDVLDDAFYKGAAILVSDKNEPPQVALVDSENGNVWLIVIYPAQIAVAS